MGLFSTWISDSTWNFLPGDGFWGPNCVVGAKNSKNKKIAERLAKPYLRKEGLGKSKPWANPRKRPQQKEDPRANNEKQETRSQDQDQDQDKDQDQDPMQNPIQDQFI